MRAARTIGSITIASSTVRRVCAVTFAALLSSVLQGAGQGDVSPAQPTILAPVFNLNHFGAVADATTDNTDAFRRAIAELEMKGGGTLIVPAGIYRTGAIGLCSGINLHLDPGSTILFTAPEMPSEGPMSPRYLLGAKNAHDIMISGAGTINGSGEAWWPLVHESRSSRKPLSHRPRM